MNPKHEVVKIQPENQKSEKNTKPAKITLRIKSEKQDVFIYNGVNQYLVQT